MDQLTDAEARRLLQAAADTVHVDPAGPLELPPRHRRWPILAAAAAVLAVVGATTLVATHQDAQTSDHRPTPTPTPSTSHTIPSVLGYDRAQATALLTELGLHVTPAPVVAGCGESQDEALSTTPALGSTVTPGQDVRLAFTRGTAKVECALEPSLRAYDVLRFARGTGPAPAFASVVAVYDGDGDTVPLVLTRQQAADPNAWQVCDSICTSPLTALVANADLPWPTGGQHFLTPALFSHVGRASSDCGQKTTLPATLADRESTELGIVAPTFGPCAAPLLHVYTDGLGDIDTVALNPAADRARPVRPTPIPSVLGYDTDQATALLTALGAKVEVRRVQTCESGDHALGTVPQNGRPLLPGEHVQLEVSAFVDTVVTCAQEAYDFLRFARGTGPAPPFAPVVSLYVAPGTPHLLSRAEARQQGDWQCSDCADPLVDLVAAANLVSTTHVGTTLVDDQITLWQTRLAAGRTECGTRLPQELRERPSTGIDVHLSVDYGPCRPTLLRLFHDSRGRIDAILLGSALRHP